MTQFFHDCLQSKRCLLIVLFALLYSAQNRVEAQGCNPDVTPPTAVCDEFTTVAVGADGTATVMAAAIDNGSYDDCCMQGFTIKRQDDGPCDADGLPDDFGASVTFCCADIGGEVLVTLRVSDCAGNFTDCFTTVTVQDKLKPTCVAPANVTTTCEQYDPSLIAYGQATVADNCCMDTVLTSRNITQFDTICNQGTLLRIFKALDCSGNSSQCTQNIVVNYNQHYAVRFPDDLIVSELSPTGDYGQPGIHEEDCELVGISFSDQIFTVVPDAALRIERTWSIINWCTFDPLEPFVFVPNPSPNAEPNHPSNLPGPIVSAAGTAAPWAPSVVKIFSTDAAPTDYSTFWAADVNGYQYVQTIKLIDTFFVAVEGTVFRDSTENCDYDTGEPLLAAWTVRVTGLVTNDIKETPTDEDGHYTVLLNGIDTVFEVTLSASGNFGQGCQTTYTLNGVVGEVVTQNVPVHLEERCALLSVGLGTPRLRRCFPNRYFAKACNPSSETVANVAVEVVLDDYLSYVSSTLPGTLVSGNTYRFEVGSLAAGECVDFGIDVVVSCNAPLGYTHCSEAKITPFDDCRVNSLWSGADVNVTATCDGDSVRLKIQNVGTGSMAEQLGYVVVEDIIMRQSGPFQLGAGNEQVITFPANGSTWRLQAEEEPLHPFGGLQAVALEGCGGLNNPGLVNLFPLSDPNPFESQDCQPNTGAFDPNDKQAFPVGFGTEHFLDANTDIEYMIRFQNTGTDTAFNIVVLDTISAYLDPSSVRVIASSHKMEFSMLEGGVIRFSFPNILLPDSNINQVASNGFLKFHIAQKLDNPDGLLIENSAAIYFDFNDPIITNTTFHTVGHPELSVGINDPTRSGKGLKVFPNPTADVATFKFDSAVELGRFELKSQLGQTVRSEQFSGDTFRFERAGLQSGVYFFEISQVSGAVFTGKILVK